MVRFILEKYYANRDKVKELRSAKMGDCTRVILVITKKMGKAWRSIPMAICTSASF
jgi:hypothetical protein